LNVENSSISSPFIAFVNVFHKYAIFASIMKYSTISGAITMGKLGKAIDDSVGPAELFMVEG
jgi:hypothetical protein